MAKKYDDSLLNLIPKITQGLADFVTNLVAPKILSPLPKEQSPGGIDDPTQPSLNYYYQREFRNEQEAKQEVEGAQTEKTAQQSNSPSQTVYDKNINYKDTLSTSKPLQDFTTTPVPNNIEPIMGKAAKEYNIPEALLASLLFSEHGLQADKNKTPNIDPKTGKVLSYDRGIAQINNVAHPEVTDEEAFDPNFAIPWAAKVLSSHIQKLGYKRGIAAYNLGEGGAMNDELFNTQGQRYLKAVEQGLSDKLKKELEL